MVGYNKFDVLVVVSKGIQAEARKSTENASYNTDLYNSYKMFVLHVCIQLYVNDTQERTQEGLAVTSAHMIINGKT